MPFVFLLLAGLDAFVGICCATIISVAGFQVLIAEFPGKTQGYVLAFPGISNGTAHRTEIYRLRPTLGTEQVIDSQFNAGFTIPERFLGAGGSACNAAIGKMPSCVGNCAQKEASNSYPFPSLNCCER